MKGSFEMHKRIGMIFVVIMTLILLVGCQKTVIDKGQGNAVTTMEQERTDTDASPEEVQGFCMGIVTEIANDTIKIAVFSADQAGSTMDNSIPAQDESDKENDSEAGEEKPYRLDMIEENLQLKLTDQTKVRIDDYEDSEDGDREDIALNSAVCVKYDTDTMEVAVIIIKVL